MRGWTTNLRRSSTGSTISITATSLSMTVTFFFFFNDPAPTEIYTTYDTLSLHDALPISRDRHADRARISADAGAVPAEIREIGRAHVGTPVTVGYLVCRLLLEKKKKYQDHAARGRRLPNDRSTVTRPGGI